MEFRTEGLAPDTALSLKRTLNRLDRTNVLSLTASATITPDHCFVSVNATSGAVTVTLPPARDCKGRFYVFVKTDASANAMTIDGDGSETISGSATVSTTTRWADFQMFSDGSQWITF